MSTHETDSDWRRLLGRLRPRTWGRIEALEQRVAALEASRRRDATAAAEAARELREMFPGLERRQW